MGKNPTEVSIWESFKIQRRVIGALLMREMLDRWGRHNIGFMWMFAEPMVFTLGVMTLWHVTGLSHSTSISPVGFAITGYSSILLWRNMPSRLIGAVKANLTLMHHRNIRLVDIFSARLVLEGLGATMSFIILTIIFSFFGLLKLPCDPLKVVVGWCMLAWLGASLAITVGALSERSDIVHTLWHPAAYLILPLSGSAFTVNALPEKFQKAVLYIPMVHGVEMLRSGFFGSGFHAHYSFQYMFIWCLALTFIGLGQMTIVGRKIVA
jgi:ABC-2 type transport system permease protein/capsular polysaccharide transport system permease protein